ncbi:MAG: elongation factor maturation arginine rhamnosyltransferase EarP [Pseudomonadota bacterium]
MRWDIFCKVIDNFGDIGVCWRLARDLAGRGQRVRLFADDASALTWMATLPHDDIEVWPWHAPLVVPDEVRSSPPDVVIEAFGCDLPEAYLAAINTPHRSPAPVWLNLEYLSAEGYVERSHLLPSPVWNGPGAGLKKVFFYPGFTERTGGLLREPGLLEQCDAWRNALRDQVSPAEKWWREQALPWRPDALRISLFCYAPSAVGPMLDAWAHSTRPIDLIVTPGQAQAAVNAWAGREGAREEPFPPLERGALRCLPLPAPLPQPTFDHLLWSCDLNVVRGEDSAVRALWAGAPHLWDIYRQDDGVHADKLHAFEARWMSDWPEALRAPVCLVQASLNGLSGLPGDGTPSAAWAWLLGPEGWPLWQHHQRASRQQLAQQRDLTTQLLEFVRSAR